MATVPAAPQNNQAPSGATIVNGIPALKRHHPPQPPPYTGEMPPAPPEGLPPGPPAGAPARPINPTLQAAINRSAASTQNRPNLLQKAGLGGAGAGQQQFKKEETVQEKRIATSLLTMATSLGDERTISIGRFKIYPLTLGRLSILKDMQCPLLMGVETKDLNLISECMKFILLMTLPLREAWELSKMQEEFEFQAVMLGDTILAHEVQTVIPGVFKMIEDATSGQIEVSKPASLSGKKDEAAPEGNDSTLPSS